jgi:hypothetical protein
MTELVETEGLQLTERQSELLRERYIDETMESLDYDMMYTMLREMYEDRVNHMTDDLLIDEIEYYMPDLLNGLYDEQSQD